MISFSFRNHSVQWTTGMVTLVLVLACNSSQLVPATQVVKVTQVIPVTQIVQVTRLATRLVPVTRIIQVTRIVEVPPAIPVATEAPIQPAAPAPTEAPAQPVAPAPTPIKPKNNNNLLVWYNFENNFLTSGYVSDISGNGFDAQTYGNVNVDDGISGGNAIFFSGDAYILAPVNPAVGRNIVSFSLWFKTEHPENNYKLASAAWWSGGPGSGWILATHIPEFWSDDTQSLYFPDITSNDNHFLSDEWMHEVVTYDGNRIKEYTNGQLINDWQTTGAIIGQGQAMAVGAWPQFGFNFVGSIDEFQIFARCLTQQEVKALYKQGQ